MCWKLVEVVPNLNLTAALLCHLTAFAVHLLAAVLLHPTHLWSDSAGKGRHHHGEHEKHCREAGEPPHSLSIFPVLSSICRPDSARQALSSFGLKKSLNTRTNLVPCLSHLIEWTPLRIG